MAANPGRKTAQLVAAPKSRAKKKPAPTLEKSSASKTLLALTRLGSVSAAAIAQRFFKTGVGQYGAGDLFLGIRVPVLRALVRDMKDAGFEVAAPLLKSGWHEARKVALMLLVRVFQQGDEKTQKRVYALYLKSSKFINNWDLVDMSAEHIVGRWLADKPALRERVLTRLAKSKSLWERRIAILATFHYIKQGNVAETLRIAQLLIQDEEDLIRKAVGWMLREVGKRVSEEKEESFLKRHYRQMPRTMLRYAIERFNEPKRKRYLLGLM